MKSIVKLRFPPWPANWRGVPSTRGFQHDSSFPHWPIRASANAPSDDVAGVRPFRPDAVRARLPAAQQRGNVAAPPLGGGCPGFLPRQAGRTGRRPRRGPRGPEGRGRQGGRHQRCGQDQCRLRARKPARRLGRNTTAPGDRGRRPGTAQGPAEAPHRPGAGGHALCDHRNRCGGPVAPRGGSGPGAHQRGRVIQLAAGFRRTAAEVDAAGRPRGERPFDGTAPHDGAPHRRRE